MKKVIGIVVLGLLITNFADSKPLKNPGDVMVDYKAFSLEECASGFLNYNCDIILHFSKQKHDKLFEM